MTERSPSGERPVVRREDVLWRRTSDGVILLAVGGSAVRVAAPGDAVWDLLDRPRTVDEIAEVLAPRYEETADAIRGDIAELLDTLAAHGVVTAGDRGTRAEGDRR